MNMKQTDENSEFQNSQNPDGQVGKMYSEEEYKNLQAFWTKANQWLINMSKKLVEKDPKELLSMDSTIQTKVIKDIWGYDNLDELKVMLPDIFEEDDYKWSNKWQWDLEQLKREQELLKMKLNKKDIDDEIEKYTSQNSELVNAIPNFDSLVREELKYISSELPIRDRVNRATKLVSWTSNINVDAYLRLQWKSNIKSSWAQVNDDYIKDAQNKLRIQLWLKIK